MRYLLAICLLLCCSLTPGRVCPAAETVLPSDGAQTSSNQEEYYDLLRLFVDTLDQVERNYVEDVTRRQLVEAAIEGMLSKLDRHSDYIAPDDLDQFKTDVESEFGGVGIQVSEARGRLTVISPLVGSPAYRAGVFAGDVITHIEGESAADFSIDEAIKRIKGPVGTSVKITFRHRRSGESEELELAREIVRVDTVLGDRRRADDSWDYLYDPDKRIGYVRVTGFARHTRSELVEALEQLQEQDMAGLILDLRMNPGGLLSSAIRVSDLFIHEGRIVSTEGRNRRPQVWEATQAGTFDGFPMAILVNRGSASASEIVAACLQDHKRAVVIGERTFGKGSVQNIVELEGGRSALKLTTAGYIRPSGKNIHRFPGASEDDQWGVRPDDGFEVTLTQVELRRMWQDRRARDLVLHRDQEEQEADEGGADETGDGAAGDDGAGDDGAGDDGAGDERVADRALLKAIEYLTEKIEQATEQD